MFLKLSNQRFLHGNTLTTWNRVLELLKKPVLSFWVLYRDWLSEHFTYYHIFFEWTFGTRYEKLIFIQKAEVYMEIKCLRFFEYIANSSWKW